MLNYYFSQLQPFSYHLVNIFMHASNCVILCLIFLSLFPRNKRLAYIAAFIFSVHAVLLKLLQILPADLLGCLFFLLAFLSYLFSHKKNSYIFLFITILLSTLGLLSKESSVTVLFFVFFMN